MVTVKAMNPARTVKVQQAKTNLSSLLRRVAEGETITIARGDTPVARLVPVDTEPRSRPMGFVSARVPDTFLDPLPEDELAAWER